MPDRPATPDPPAGGPQKLPEPGTASPTPEDVVRDLIEHTPGITSAETAAQARPEAGGVGRPSARILFLDVDGTLTDGVIVEHHDGDSRHFWVRDGLALQWARDLGILPVVISGRPSRAVEHRMKDLGLECHVGVQDKVAVAEQVLRREGARWEECVMVGDDLPDVALMKRVGWPVAVADAQPEVKALARTLTMAPGGRGAVREMVEILLKHNGTWPKVLERYGAS